jgi:hypothetical protein
VYEGEELKGTYPNSVFSGEWIIGRIYEVRGGPKIYAGSGRGLSQHPESLRTDNRVASMEAAKAGFEASWKQWKAWAKLEEVP